MNEIIDILEEENLDVDEIVLNPPDGDESEGYDESDNEGDVENHLLARPILQAEVAEVRIIGEGSDVLEAFEVEGDGEEAIPQPLEDCQPRLKKPKEFFCWDETCKSFI